MSSCYSISGQFNTNACEHKRRNLKKVRKTQYKTLSNYIENPQQHNELIMLPKTTLRDTNSIYNEPFKKGTFNWLARQFCWTTKKYKTKSEVKYNPSYKTSNKSNHEYYQQSDEVALLNGVVKKREHNIEFVTTTILETPCLNKDLNSDSDIESDFLLLRKQIGINNGKQTKLPDNIEIIMEQNSAKAKPKKMKKVRKMKNKSDSPPKYADMPTDYDNQVPLSPIGILKRSSDSKSNKKDINYGMDPKGHMFVDDGVKEWTNVTVEMEPILPEHSVTKLKNEQEVSDLFENLKQSSCDPEIYEAALKSWRVLKDKGTIQAFALMNAMQNFRKINDMKREEKPAVAFSKPKVTVTLQSKNDTHYSHFSGCPTNCDPCQIGYS